MEDLCIEVSLHNDVRHRHLHCSSEATQPAPHSGHCAKLDEWGKTCGEADREGIGVVEPEQAGDTADVVIHDEAEEPIVLQLLQRDSAHDFHVWDQDSSIVKRCRCVWRWDTWLD